MRPQTPSKPIQRFVPSIRHLIWRGLPQELRRRALARATAWAAPKPSPRRAPVAPGLAIVGELSRASGLGEGARLMATAARRMDLPLWTVDLPPPADARPEIEAIPSQLPPPGVPLVLHVNAPMLPLALLRLPAHVTRNRPIIGYWAWEMPQVPPDWRPALACVNQIWVPSRFTAAALEPLMPRQVKVVPPAIALAPPAAAPLGRADFGLPQDGVVVLVSFNLASSFHRKNPLAAIAAFRAAFGSRLDRILLLKVGHPEHAPADYAKLVRIAQAPNIRVETRTLSTADCHALTACADIVLSLHRGEGFGLVMAEAMLLGKPVIATGWSGNTDFMDSTNAALVDCRLVPAQDDRAVYRGTWAEPDVAQAAMLLRALADDPAARSALGKRAQASVQAGLDGRPLLAALEALR